MRLKSKQQKISAKKMVGFTLVEILVYIAVLSIVILAISSFLLWSIQSNNKAKVMRETLDNARRAMEIMTYEIKGAKSISPTSTATYLSLEKKDGSYIDVYLDETTLYRKEESKDPIALTSNKVEVNNLEFTYIATATTTPSVQISLTVNYKNPANRPEYQAAVNLKSTTSLRTY